MGKSDVTGEYAHAFVPDVGEQTAYFKRVLKVNAGRAINMRVWQKYRDAYTQWFFRSVKSGGPWDLKLCARRVDRAKKWFGFNNRRISLEDFGNIHYGYVGRASGKYSLGDLKFGSLWAARFKNDSNERRDREWIAYGWRLAGSWRPIHRDHRTQIDRFIYPGYVTARGFAQLARYLP